MAFDYRSSLLRRLQAVHSLYHDACATMTLEQVNAVVVPNVLPIAFSLVHQVLIEDSTVVFAGGPLPQFGHGWAERIGLAVPDHGKERSVGEMMHQRIGDYASFVEFQLRVFAATEDYVASVPSEAWDEIIVSHPYGPTVANTFSARVGAERGISRSDALESWVYQHALRHMGEIEHARALVGLTGMTS
ncbi:MAG TPA: hypothetical protein VMV96_01560 [Acidimicrobiales bacterium]|nr:hypothetical protein [Acidimicrobiales bacterium]